MRRLLGRDAAIAALVFGLAFSVYGAIAPSYLLSYEDETAAVAEGIFRGYGAEVPPDTDLTGAEPGTRSRTGILQPAAMVPFHALGAGLDEIASGGDDYTYRSFLSRLYSAFVMALAAAALFVFVRLYRDRGWSLAVALLFAFASLALPYAGYGMEPTGTLLVVLAYLSAAYAARTGRLSFVVLTALVCGLAGSTRPTTVLPALGAFLLLAPRVGEAGPRERRGLIGAAVIPFAIAGAAFLLYNQYRYGDPLDTGYHGVPYDIGAAPTAFMGLWVSPGNGLIWFSPLVILGLLGMRRLWDAERALTVALIGGLFLAMVPFVGPFWGGDAWGPRYMTCVAWMPLVAIPWWTTTLVRKRVLAGFAVVAVWVQMCGSLIGVLPQVSALMSGQQTGVPVSGSLLGIPTSDIPYGDDPPRWIPDLSILRFNSAALVSIAARNAGLDSIELSYHPLRGKSTSVDLGNVPLNVWWNGGAPLYGVAKPSSLWLAPFLLLAAGSAAGLWALWRRPGEARPS